MNAHATIPLARLFEVNAGVREEMTKVQDVKLSARRLYETAIAFQSIPLYPECATARASAKHFYDLAMKEMLEAMNG